MSPQEFWWEFDTKVRQQRKLEKQLTPAGKFSEAEWEAARIKFKEMEDGGTTDGTTR
jgi:hypothetical protein